MFVNFYLGDLDGFKYVNKKKGAENDHGCLELSKLHQLRCDCVVFPLRHPANSPSAIIRREKQNLSEVSYNKWTLWFRRWMGKFQQTTHARTLTHTNGQPDHLWEVRDGRWYGVGQKTKRAKTMARDNWELEAGGSIEKLYFLREVKLNTSPLT